MKALKGNLRDRTVAEKFVSAAGTEATAEAKRVWLLSWTLE